MPLRAASLHAELGLSVPMSPIYYPLLILIFIRSSELIYGDGLGKEPA